MERKTLWELYTPTQLTEMNEIAERYKACMDTAKTERECVRMAVDMATAAGYVPLSGYSFAWRKVSRSTKATPIRVIGILPFAP